MTYKTQNFDRIAFVSPTFVDNENTHEFSTIQAAIDYVYSTYSYELNEVKQAIVMVGTGKYEEQIHSYEHITISGYEYGKRPSATLYNTGVDSAHYPLRSDEDEHYNIIGMSILTDASGVFGKIPNTKFVNCHFRNGNFIERNSTCLAIFNNCSFFNLDYGGFYFVGTNLTGTRNILLQDCSDTGVPTTPTITSTHTSWANFSCDNVELEGNISVGGNWDWRLYACRIFGYSQRNNINTTGELNIVNSIITNGLHFASEPDAFLMINSSFKYGSSSDIPVGEADITADVVITDSNYSNNIQHNGLSGNVKINNPIKAVGADASNKYFSIQDAIDSITTEGIIDLSADFANLAELTIPNNTKVTIDGHRSYSLSFTANIATLGLGEILIFNRLSNLIGGTVEIDGNNSGFHMHSCPCGDNLIQILATSGTDSKVHLRNTNVTGDAGNSVIQIDNVDTIYKISYCRLIGATGQPAIEFSVDADNTLQTRFSTFVHGDGGANSPITTVNGYDVSYAMYSCGLNAALNPAQTTNTIGSAGNIVDAGIDF